MRRGRPTRFGTALLVIIVLAVFVGGLFLAGQALFGNGSSTKTDNLSAGQKLLNKPTDSTAVRMSVRGPIVASENHYSIVITVSQTARSITTYRGYDGEVITSQNLGNSEAAFSDLMVALKRASFMSEDKGASSDSTGACAIGQLIFFEIMDNDKSVQKLWTSSCSGVPGNFAGLTINVEELFLDQIPNSRDVIDSAKKSTGN